MADAAMLANHLRSDVPCAKRDVVHIHGIDEAQEKKLRERKKTSTALTEEQKWKDIYMIIFPKANKNVLPSPCESLVHASKLALTFTNQTTTAETP